MQENKERSGQTMTSALEGILLKRFTTEGCVTIGEIGAIISKLGGNKKSVDAYNGRYLKPRSEQEKSRFSVNNGLDIRSTRIGRIVIYYNPSVISKEDAEQILKDRINNAPNEEEHDAEIRKSKPYPELTNTEKDTILQEEAQKEDTTIQRKGIKTLVDILAGGITILKTERTGKRPENPLRTGSQVGKIAVAKSSHEFEEEQPTLWAKISKHIKESRMTFLKDKEYDLYTSWVLIINSDSADSDIQDSPYLPFFLHTIDELASIPAERVKKIAIRVHKQRKKGETIEEEEIQETPQSKVDTFVGIVGKLAKEELSLEPYIQEFREVMPMFEAELVELADPGNQLDNEPVNADTSHYEQYDKYITDTVAFATTEKELEEKTIPTAREVLRQFADSTETTVILTSQTLVREVAKQRMLHAENGALIVVPVDKGFATEIAERARELLLDRSSIELQIRRAHVPLYPGHGHELVRRWLHRYDITLLQQYQPKLEALAADDPNAAEALKLLTAKDAQIATENLKANANTKLQSGEIIEKSTVDNALANVLFDNESLFRSLYDEFISLAYNIKISDVAVNQLPEFESALKLVTDEFTKEELISLIVDHETANKITSLMSTIRKASGNRNLRKKLPQINKELSDLQTLQRKRQTKQKELFPQNSGDSFVSVKIRTAIEKKVAEKALQLETLLPNAPKRTQIEALQAGYTLIKNIAEEQKHVNNT